MRLQYIWMLAPSTMKSFLKANLTWLIVYLCLSSHCKSSQLNGFNFRINLLKSTTTTTGDGLLYLALSTRCPRAASETQCQTDLKQYYTNKLAAHPGFHQGFIIIKWFLLQTVVKHLMVISIKQKTAVVPANHNTKVITVITKGFQKKLLSHEKKTFTII